MPFSLLLGRSTNQLDRGIRGGYRATVSRSYIARTSYSRPRETSPNSNRSTHNKLKIQERSLLGTSQVTEKACEYQVVPPADGGCK